MSDSGPHKVSRRRLLGGRRGRGRGGAAGARAGSPPDHSRSVRERAGPRRPRRRQRLEQAREGLRAPRDRRQRGPAVNGFDPAAHRARLRHRRVTREGGRTVRTFEMVAEDKEIEVAPGVKYAAWTYNGRVPGPDAAGDRGRPRPGEVRERLRPPAHDPLPRHPHRAPRRRARGGAGQHRARASRSPTSSRRRRSACTSTTATPPRWPTTSPRASTARSSSTRRSRGRRPTSW